MCTDGTCHCEERVLEARKSGPHGRVVEVCRNWLKKDAMKFHPQPPADLNLQELDMDGQELKSGTKKDEGKARLDLVPFEVVTAVAEILTNGAKKYAARNWERGIAYGRVYSGVLRHLFEWWISRFFGRDGINHADGKNSHLDHAITGLMFLSAYEKRGFNGSEFDDRPSIDGVRSNATGKSEQI